MPRADELLGFASVVEERHRGDPSYKQRSCRFGRAALAPPDAAAPAEHIDGKTGKRKKRRRRAA